MELKKIELLSPAKDYETGKAAIDHGADAVYIGGLAFGARVSAGNSMADIESLAQYAHLFGAKVYLALNTILFDRELDQAAELAHQAWDAGIDALIIQDMGLLELDLPPIPLIASTQMNNTDVEHIKFLEKVGFKRAILGRELSLKQISEIRKHTAIELEAFVHGSLCVGLSGRCYLSAALGGRSANRGVCGQPCRLKWKLKDADGNIIEKGRHLLSLKDMDRSVYLEDLIDAGITSFKIEGRLKDVAYVKNITAFYRKRLDGIIDVRRDLKRASSGRTEILFEPDPVKTFCRGASAYLLTEKDEEIWSPDTPKSMGEEIGSTADFTNNGFYFKDKLAASLLHPGDGLCFFDESRELKGLQVVKIINGCVIVHSSLNGLKTGMKVFRNRDHEFLKRLEGKTAQRRIGVSLKFFETEEGFALSGIDEDGIRNTVISNGTKEPAKNQETARATIEKQLLKFGDTIFYPLSLNIETGSWFLKTSDLNGLRRELVEVLMQKRKSLYVSPTSRLVPDNKEPYPLKQLGYNFNVSNKAAREFYLKHGVETIEPAFELRKPLAGDTVMTTKLCLRRCLDSCLKNEKRRTLKEPFTIEYAGKCFSLRFDCKNCTMTIAID